MTDPVPWQVVHVVCIWNPLSITYDLVPCPPQLPHVERAEPFLRPIPEHVSHCTIGVMLIVREVPLQASMKLISMVVSTWAPRTGPWAFIPGPNAPNSCSNRSPRPPVRPPPNAPEKSWKPNPKGEPPPKERAFSNALASKPGCWDAAPYLSYSALFFSSFRIWKGPRVNAQKLWSGTADARRKPPVSRRTLPGHSCLDLCQGGIFGQAIGIIGNETGRTNIYRHTAKYVFLTSAGVASFLTPSTW